MGQIRFSKSHPKHQDKDKEVFEVDSYELSAHHGCKPAVQLTVEHHLKELLCPERLERPPARLWASWAGCFSRGAAKFQQVRCWKAS